MTERERENERRERGNEGWGGERLEEKRKVEEKAFVKLKGRAPSDGVGQGKRVTGRSNWQSELM